MPAITVRHGCQQEVLNHLLRKTQRERIEGMHRYSPRALGLAEASPLVLASAGAGKVKR